MRWTPDLRGANLGGERLTRRRLCEVRASAPVAHAPILPNDKETNIGGGDSGGPSFLYDNGEYFLMCNNTFGGTFEGQTAGAFGAYFGGMLLSAYTDYLLDATDGRIQTTPPFRNPRPTR